MASLQMDPSGNWHIHFRFAGKRFKRSLKTKDEDEARGLRGRIEDNIRLVERGVRVIPNDADAYLFLLSDGQVQQPVEIPDDLTLQQLFKDYKESVEQSLEPTTFYTIGVHSKHLLRLLGAKLNPRSLRQENLQDYINARQKERTQKDTKVTPTTIRKEIATLSAIWSWAPDSYQLHPFPNKRKLRYGKTAEKPAFQTWAEIERQIRRGGLKDELIAELWDCLFLSISQTTQLLNFLKKTACPPFLYPMVVMAAHTGARRSELIRSQVNDFEDGAVILHEAKRLKGKRSTRRVPMSTLLRRVMKAWLQNHPGGQFTFCQKKANGPEPLTKDQAHDHFKRSMAESRWEVVRGWHVLRHSFISNCALKGIDQRIIDSFVGHTTDEMRKRYTHLFPSAKKDAIKSVFG